jgi:hypothetical protein
MEGVRTIDVIIISSSSVNIRRVISSSSVNIRRGLREHDLVDLTDSRSEMLHIDQVSFVICMLTLLPMPLAGLQFCVGLDFVTPFGCNQVNNIIIMIISRCPGPLCPGLL